MKSIPTPTMLFRLIMPFLVKGAALPFFTLVIFVVTLGYWEFYGGPQDTLRPSEVVHRFIQSSGRTTNSRNEIEVYREKILRERLAESEEAYQKYVKMRWAYVGEDPSKVIAWPPEMVLYLWDYFLPSFSCPYTIQRIGTIGDGGKWVCGMELYDKKKNSLAEGKKMSPCVVYSFGVAKESSFEAEILDRTDCEIFAYDRSVDKMGPQVTEGDPRVHFNKVFISAFTGNTLSGLMKKNDHQFIDFLKMDIEGHELQVLNQIMDEFEVLPFGQLAVEIHADQEGKLFPELYNLWGRLESKGLRPFKNEMNHWPCVRAKLNPIYAEYSFINTKGPSRLLPPFPLK